MVEDAVRQVDGTDMRPHRETQQHTQIHLTGRSEYDDAILETIATMEITSTTGSTRPSVDLGLTGCVAIVGGSSSGMGRAIARALAGEGCSVTLFARRETELAEEAERIESDFSGTSALAVAGDSTDPLALKRVVEETLERFERLDIVVNNTGGPPAGDFGDFDDQGVGAAYELSVLSAIRLTRHALPALRESGRGRVVNVTSSTVKEPADGLLLANALRPSVVGWAKHLSREEGPNGVTVNCIAPDTSTPTGSSTCTRSRMIPRPRGGRTRR